MQMVGPWGRYLPQWLRAPGNGSGPAICQHTHTHWTLPHTMSVLETPFDIHVSSVYQTHTCMQAPVSTLCISAKKTHNKGSRTRPIMSTLMPRSGIPVICSLATLSCDSSYCKVVAELPSLTDVRIPFPLTILKMNRQNLTKICGLVHHNIFQSFQFSVINLFLSPDSTIVGL